VVSAEELASYEGSLTGGLNAAGIGGASSTSGTSSSTTGADTNAIGATDPSEQRDSARELAHALHQLRAYAENSGSDAVNASSSNASANADGSTSSISVSV
jgi:hypothetical protein